MIRLTRRTALAAAMVASLAAAPAAFADETAPIFYNITTDDTWTAGMALAQANTAAARGHPVTVFLNVRGVRVADRDAKLGTFAPAGKSPHELLSALMAKGQTVLVCGACMGVAGMDADDLIDGAQRATPDLTFGALTAEGTITLSY